MLPGDDRSDANEWVSVAIPTGLGELRNGLIVRTADAMVAVGGAYGTLSEIALGLQAGLKVYGLHTWEIDGIELWHAGTRSSRRSLLPRALRASSRTMARQSKTARAAPATEPTAA